MDKARKLLSPQNGQIHDLKINGDQKLMIIIPSLGGGGAERAASILSSEWAQSRSVTVVVFERAKQSFSHGGELLDLGLAGGKSTTLIKLFRVLRRAFRLRKILSRLEPDVIVSFMESANFPSILACTMNRRLGSLILSVHGNPNDTTSKWERIGMKLLYPLARKVVAPSAGMTETLHGLGLPAKILLTIPNPSNIQISSISPASPIHADFPFILGVGRLDRVKRFDHLIQAFSMLPIKNLRLVILGEGIEMEALIDLALDLGIANRVIFPGFVGDLEPWYRNAQCLCITSISESFSYGAIEALGYGCPVISYDVDFGPREILMHGAVGVLVPEGQIDSLSKEIFTLLSNDVLRKKYSDKGLERYCDFEARIVAPRWFQH